MSTDVLPAPSRDRGRGATDDGRAARSWWCDRGVGMEVFTAVPAAVDELSRMAAELRTGVSRSTY
ncbi:hypothetical protein [Geodermatophilus sp. SYSU D00079]